MQTDEHGSDDELVPPDTKPAGCWYCEGADHEDTPCPQRTKDVDSFIARYGRTDETETSV